MYIIKGCRSWQHCQILPWLLCQHEMRTVLHGECTGSDYQLRWKHQVNTLLISGQPF